MMSFIIYHLTLMNILKWKKRIYNQFIAYDQRHWERYICVFGNFKIRLIVMSQITISTGYEDPILLEIYYKDKKIKTLQNYRAFSYDPYVPKLRSYLYTIRFKHKYIKSSIFNEEDVETEKLRAIKIMLIRKQIELID